MWNGMPPQWRACFEEAWDAYCHGSMPVGAAIVGPDGNILARGRNRIYERVAPPGQVAGTKLAHAEINALLQVRQGDERCDSYTLYSTMEPCPLCFGALYMSGIRAMRYAARDGFAGSSNLAAIPGYLSVKTLDVAGPFPDMEPVQMALHTAHFMERCPKPLQDELLAVREAYCPDGIHLGRELHATGWLVNARQEARTAAWVFGEVMRRLGLPEAEAALGRHDDCMTLRR
ncbi:MAG: nucleoside deaminase [Bacillota bacterium]